MKKKVLVIGGGLAGSLICNELVRHFDVTLLEKGAKDSITFPKVSFVKKRFAEVSTFCYGGGGTTNLWHNGLIPINIDDITCREFREVLSDAQSYVDKAASCLFFDKASYSVEYKKALSEMSSLCGMLTVFTDGVDCLLYPKQYKKLTVAPKVNIFYCVDAIDFVFKDNKIKTVNYSIRNSNYSTDADIIIISAGTLGTPKVLSRLISSTGSCVKQLGVGLIDHPMGFVGKVRFKKDDIGKIIKKLSSDDKGSYISRNAVRIKSKCGRYTACAFFRPALTMDNNPSIYKYKSSLGASNGMARMKNIFSWKLFHPDIIAEIFSHLFGVNISSRTYNILFIAEQKRGNNRVYYDDEELNVEWSITDEEIAIYRDMLIKLKDMLTKISDVINIETNITEDWLWSHAHHSCTTPLGSTADDIIDKDLKLKFCDNVYVCDASVIQEHSYANTGLTIGQLAFRLAEKVLDTSRDHSASNKILVTGASGFLGRRTVEMLVAKGYSVRALVRKTSKIDHLLLPNVQLFFGDVADQESLRSAFEGIEYVVHTAADTSGSEEAGRRSTIQGTQNILDLCDSCQVKKLVYISSCAVYGVADYRAQQVVDEDAALERFPERRGAYSWAKMEAEKLVSRHMTQGETPVVCLRPGAIYGPGGAIYTPMLGFALGTKFFAVIGDGEFVLPLVYVDNLVEAIILSLKSPDAAGQIYNVTDPDRITKRRYMDLLIQRMYPWSKLIYLSSKLLYFTVVLQEKLLTALNRRPVLTRYRLTSSQKPVVYDATKIMKHLNWQPSVSFEMAVERLIQHTQEK